MSTTMPNHSTTNQPNKNKYLQILIDHLTKLDGSPTLDDVAEYIGIQKKSLLKHFTTPQTPFPLKIVRLLHFGFNIPYKKFLLSQEEVNIFLKENKNVNRNLYYIDEDIPISTKWTSKPSDLKKFYDLEYSTSMAPGAEKNFLGEYPAIIKEYVGKIEKVFGVYEYLGKGNTEFPEHLDTYTRAHEDIFYEIENVIGTINKGRIIYSRYIALPYGKINDMNDKSFESCAQEVLKLCSISLFTHICRCLKMFSTQKNKKSIRFYIVARPWRPYHTAIIENENEKFIFSEYFRYSKTDGGLLPNLLFIESVQSEERNILFNTYRKEMHGFSLKSSNKKWYFKSIEEFRKIAYSAYENLCSRKNDEIRKQARTMKCKIEKMEELFDQ